MPICKSKNVEKKARASNEMHFVGEKTKSKLDDQ